MTINDVKRLEQENAELKAKIKKYAAINEQETKDYAELKAENEKLYEEKDCLHKIIDRLLENAGYSKDIASAEDFEDVYENMQYKNNKLEEYNQTLQEIKAIAERKITYIDFRRSKSCIELEYDYARITYELEQKIFDILQKITKAESEG